MSTKCNRLDLELLFTGELSGKAAESVRQHIAACSDCSSLYARYEAQKKDFLEKHPFSSFTQAHAPLKMAPWYTKLFAPAMRPVLVPVFGALIIGVALLPTMTGFRHSMQSDIRFKGKSSIGYFFQRDGKVYQENSWDRFIKGDRIQIVYTSPRKQFLALTSLDVHGTVSFYGGDSSANTCSIPVEQGTELPFPSSIELDDSPGSELVIALFTDQPLLRAVVKSQLSSYFMKFRDLEKVKAFVVDHPDAVKASVAAVLLLAKE